MDRTRWTWRKLAGISHCVVVGSTGSGKAATVDSTAKGKTRSGWRRASFRQLQGMDVNVVLPMDVGGSKSCKSPL